MRFVGFTGHKDPQIHLKMLNTGFPFDSVQMPLNVFDSQFHSFETLVLPELNKRGIAALGMKPISGHGEPVKHGVVTAQEALRYAMSLPGHDHDYGNGEHGSYCSRTWRLRKVFSRCRRRRCRRCVTA